MTYIIITTNELETGVTVHGPVVTRYSARNAARNILREESWFGVDTATVIHAPTGKVIYSITIDDINEEA